MALKRDSRCRRQPGNVLARLSTSQKPALWRVCSYSGPGLPRPTIRRMGMALWKIKKCDYPGCGERQSKKAHRIIKKPAGRRVFESGKPNIAIYLVSPAAP